MTKDPHSAAPIPASHHLLAWGLCAATLLLIVAGALVTSTGSGLSVPDWPLAYGRVFPSMVGGVAYEHGHRLIASAVGLFTLCLALRLQWKDPRPSVRLLGWLLLAAVILQGGLGGLTVLFLLPAPISIAHALLAHSFFAATVILVALTRTQTDDLGAEAAPWLRWAFFWALASVLTIFCEIVLGALVRHWEAGLAIPDFPLAFGRFVPYALSAPPVLVHYLHRVVGGIVFLVALGCVWQCRKSPPAIRWHAFGLLLCLGIQIALGGAVVLSRRATWITTVHVANGTLIFGAAILLAWRLGAILRALRASAREPHAAA